MTSAGSEKPIAWRGSAAEFLIQSGYRLGTRKAVLLLVESMQAEREAMRIGILLAPINLLAPVVAAIATLVVAGHAQSQTQQDLMKVCADEWNSLKSANQTAGKIYQDFVKDCLARYQPSAKPSVPANGTINLNTATAAELDALPLIGKVHSKAIIEARAKGLFRNWDDFAARKIVPSNTEAAIKALVSF
jgi:DNA uptake protein ComE-like DNA-binding protein